MDNLNIKIETALQDKNIINIMNKACGRFYNQLDNETLYTCKINALWKAFVNFDDKKNTKFTTYLYKGVTIECLKALAFETKTKRLNLKSLHDNLPEHKSHIKMVEILDEIHNEEDKELLLDRISNMTIQEMADKRSYSRETVRKKLKKILEHLKNQLA